MTRDTAEGNKEMVEGKRRKNLETIDCRGVRRVGREIERIYQEMRLKEPREATWGPEGVAG